MNTEGIIVKYINFICLQTNLKMHQLRAREIQYKMRIREKESIGIKKSQLTIISIIKLDNKISELMDLIPNLKLKTLQQYIPKLEKNEIMGKNISDANTRSIINNLYFLKDYEQKVKDLKKEITDIKTRNDIDELINNSKNTILNLSIKLEEKLVKLARERIREIQIKLNELEKQDFEYIMNNIINLKDYKKELTELKEEITAPEILNKIDELINHILDLLLKIIENYINKLEKEDIENIGTYNINNHINNLQEYKKEITELKEEINYPEIKNKIEELLNQISNLLIKLFEKYIPKLEKEDFENIDADEIKKHINILKDSKKGLTELKEENITKITLNKIDELIKYIPSLILKLFEKYIYKIENNVEFMDAYSIQDNINNLNDFQKELTESKEEKNISENINKIDDFLNKIPILAIKLFEIYIPKLEKDLEEINIC